MIRTCTVILFVLFSGINPAFSQSAPCSDNISCDMARVLSVPVSGIQYCFTGCNEGMPAGPKLDQGQGCDWMANPAAWFRFNTGDNNRAQFSVSSDALRHPKVALLKYCDSLVECNPSITSLAPQTDYFLVVTDDNAAEGDFDLCITLFYATDSCLFRQSLDIIGTSLGSPLSGPFKPCEEIRVRYRVAFDRKGDNWLHSIVPQISSCYDYQQGQEPDNSVRPSGNNTWFWVEEGVLTWKAEQDDACLVGYDPADGRLLMKGQPGFVPFGGEEACSSSGTPMPAAWVGPAFSETCGSSEPNLAWGDNRSGTHEVTFTLKIPCDACPGDCNDYTVSMAYFGDGQTGGYRSNYCSGSVMASRRFNVSCCEKPSLTAENDLICSKSRFRPDIHVEPAGSTFSWEVIAPEGIVGAMAGKSGDGPIDQLLVNNTDENKKVIYKIVPLSATGCPGDTVTAEVTVFPAIFSNVEPDLVNCLDSFFYLEVYPGGGTGDDFTYQWSTGSTDNWVYLLTDHDLTLTLQIKDEIGCTETDTFFITTITEPVALPADPSLKGNNVVFIYNYNTFSVAPFEWAQFYEWSIDGVVVGYGRTSEFRIPLLSIGTHNLCVRAYNSCDYEGQSICWELKVIESPLKSDCTGAELICDKKARTVTFPGTPGLMYELNTGDFCYGNTYGEQNSIWYTFQIIRDGRFWFTIKPRSQVDIDFIVFKKVNDLGCYTKQSVRCSYAGGGDCNGNLGLSPDETDVYEGGGCDTQNNFLAALDCEAGDVYYLAINLYNTSEQLTFDMDFCGDALLSCDADSSACIPLNTAAPFDAGQVTVMPNPSDGNFDILIPSYFAGSIELVNTQGRVEKKVCVSRGTSTLSFDQSGLSPGMYSLLFKDVSGRFHCAKKLMIVN